MKFLELNKKRHAVKEFNDKPVDYKDLRTANARVRKLSATSHNIQPWKSGCVKKKIHQQHLQLNKNKAE